jgi:hypothetical protein
MLGQIKRPGARHPVLAAYGVSHRTDVICPECGEVVYQGSKKDDPSDATLPESVYACLCAYFSASQLVLPLRQDEWAREVRRLGRDAPPSDPLLRAASEVNAWYGALLAKGQEMINLMIAIGENSSRLKPSSGTATGKPGSKRT